MPSPWAIIVENNASKQLKKDALLLKSEPVLRRLAQILQKETEIAFRQKHDPKTRKKWKSRKKKQKWGILWRYGDLKRQSKFGIDNGAVIGYVSGSAASYARTHQFGDPKRNIPARPFMGLDRRRKVIKDFEKWVTGWIAKQ